MPDFERLTATLRRAEKAADRHGWNRFTGDGQHLYGRAAVAIEELTAETVTTYGVILDSTGSTDVYDTFEEAAAAYAPGCRIIRIETRDVDITDLVATTA